MTADRTAEEAIVMSVGRRGWRRVKTSFAGEFEARVHPRLGEIAASLHALEDAMAAVAGSLAVVRQEMAELSDVVAVHVDVANQATELLGRLLASATTRLEIVEESLKGIDIAEAHANLGNGIASHVGEDPATGGRAEEPAAERARSR
jgi:hypothetical protein